MPSNDQHLKQAAHNEGLLSFLRQQAQHILYGDWYVTIAFYAAIHHIEAMLYTIKHTIRGGSTVQNPVFVKHSSDARKAWSLPTDHGARERILKCSFHNIYDPYMNLYQLSQTAKYNYHQTSEFEWGGAVSTLERIKTECEIVRGG